MSDDDVVIINSSPIDKPNIKKIKKSVSFKKTNHVTPKLNNTDNITISGIQIPIPTLYLGGAFTIGGILLFIITSKLDNK